MPTSLIETIARTNTIDEWRIQTNKSASDLNDLGFYVYDKNQGTLIISNTASLSITAEGTPLSVANNVLFQNNLTLSNNLYLGVQSSGTGNIVMGGTANIGGPGRALFVSNNALVGTDFEVRGNSYTDTLSVNTTIGVSGSATIDGVVKLTGSGNVFFANVGTVSINVQSSNTITTANLITSNLTAAVATIGILNPIAAAQIGILETVSGNIYYHSSNTITANTINAVDIVANATGNIVTLTSNVATINTLNVTTTSTIEDAVVNTLDVSSEVVDNSVIFSGNVLTLLSNVATINNLSGTSVTYVNGDITNLTSDDSIIDTLSVTTAATIASGNVVNLTSNVAQINTANISNLTIVNASIEVLNVSSQINIDSGFINISGSSNGDAIIIDSGLSSLKDTTITGNLSVQGIFTQSGPVNINNDRIVINAYTPTNQDGSVIVKRVLGNNAVVMWDESLDYWTITSGNTYTQAYKILDRSDIYDNVNSTSTVLVPSANAVNITYNLASKANIHSIFGYTQANSAFAKANANFAHANAAFTQSNTVYSVANTNFLHANAAFNKANTATSAASQADQRAVTSGVFANAAFARANTVSSTNFLHANAAFNRANSNFASINALSIYTSSSYTTANAAVADAANSALSAQTAYISANTAYDIAVYANTLGQTAYTAANTAYALASALSGDTTNFVLYTSASTQTVNSNLTVSGANAILVKLPGTELRTNSTKFENSFLTLNSNILQTAGPSKNAGLEVDRGTSNNVYIRYNETGDVWEFTNNGTNYSAINKIADKANGITGGSASALVYQSATNTTGFINAPTGNGLNKFLKYTNSGYSWVDIPTPDLSTVNFAATQITSGRLATNRLSGTYAISISGSAASATTAGSTTSVTYGGTVTTGTAGSNAITLTNYGKSYFARRVEIVGSTTSNKSDTPQTAAIKVTGDVAVSSDVWATNFRGVATSALYADLAEKYLADAEYPVGTVMSIGGVQEVTASTEETSHSVLGVISENPAFAMNEGLEGGTYIALKGRVPVRVIGRVMKGDRLAPSDIKGIAKVDNNKVSWSFAIALQDGEDVVEAVIL